MAGEGTAQRRRGGHYALFEPPRPRTQPRDMTREFSDLCVIPTDAVGLRVGRWSGGATIVDIVVGVFTQLCFPGDRKPFHKDKGLLAFAKIVTDGASRGTDLRK